MSTYLRDLVERTLASFAAGALSAIPLDALNITNLDWKAALGVGTATALVSLLKGAVAKFRGSPDSASLSSRV